LIKEKILKKNERSYLKVKHANETTRPFIVIIFTGKVGSGKSTHIQLASALLKVKSLAVHRTYVKTLFILTLLLNRILQAFGSSINRHVFVWRFCVAVDLAVNIVLMPLIAYIRTRFVPSLLRKKIVLVEEHLPGTIVDYMHAAILLNLTKLVVRFIPYLFRLMYIDVRNSLIVYTYCDDNQLAYRWRLRGTSPEAKTYLKVQELVFNSWCKHLSTTCIKVNTNGYVTSVSKKLVEKILKYLR
jgi:energy-coupling factor transporter ATP-binding protein EcfA2